MKALDKVDLSLLIQKLVDNGFEIGVDTYLSINSLIRSKEHITSDNIKYCLCALIAKSKEQRDLFFQAFEESHKQDFESSGYENNIAGSSSSQAKREQEGSRISRRQTITVFSLLVGALVVLWLIKPHLFSKIEEVPLQETITQKTSDLELDPPPLINQPNEISGLSSIPLEIPEISKANKASTPETKSLWVFDLLMSLSFLTLTLIILYFLRRKYVITWSKNLKLHGFWTIPVPDIDVVYMPSHYYASSRLMNEKIRSGNKILDIANSVRETAKRGGAVKLRYTDQKYATNFLVLIDKRTDQNHFSNLFTHISQKLARDGASIVRFYFDGFPEVCWSSDYPRGIRISKVQELYYDHRLLIFGTGLGFFNPITGKLGGWSKIFDEWAHKAILTPKLIETWGWDEWILNKTFLIVPATTEGMKRVAQQFQKGQEKPILRNLDIKYHLSFPENGEISKKWLKEIFQEKEKKIDLYTWICACAIYPEISWEMTLHLGKMLSDCTNSPKLLSEENLFLLSQIPWFQEGKMPEDIKEELLMDPALDEYRSDLLVMIYQLLDDSLKKQKSSDSELRIGLNKELLKLVTSRSERQKIKEVIKRLKEGQNVNSTGSHISKISQIVSPKKKDLTLHPRIAAILFGSTKYRSLRVVITVMISSLIFVAGTLGLYESWSWRIHISDRFYSGTNTEYLTLLGSSEGEDLRAYRQYNEQLRQGKVSTVVLDVVEKWTNDSQQQVVNYNKGILEFNRGAFYESIQIWKSILHENASHVDSIQDRIALAYFEIEKSIRDFAFPSTINAISLIDSSYSSQTAKDLGLFLAELEFEKIGNLTEGRRTALSKKVGFYGYLDSLYYPVIDFEFTEVSNFKDGKAIVKIRNNHIIIDNFGNDLKLYDKIFPPSEGIYRVSRNGFFGYIDRNAKQITSISYTEATDFQNGLALVNSDLEIDVLGNVLRSNSAFLAAKYLSRADSLLQSGSISQALQAFELADSISPSLVIKDQIAAIYEARSRDSNSSGLTSVRRPLRLPSEYSDPNEDILDQDLHRRSVSLTNRTWTVFCDRSNIRTTKGKPLNFMEKLWVVDERDNELHVTKYDPNRYNFILEEFIEPPIDLGWVPKDHLLLWSEGLITKKGRSRVKALLGLRAEQMNNYRRAIIDEGEPSIFQFYNDPYSNESVDKDLSWSDFFFVYKEENNRALISAVPRFRLASNLPRITGWVAKNDLEYWKSNVALEPNWSSPAIQERDQYEIQPAVFQFKSQSEDFSSGSITNSAALWSDPYRTRKHPSWRRFPILSNEENQFQVALSSQVFSVKPSSDEKITAEQYARYRELYDSQVITRNNVNIVFALDATIDATEYMDDSKELIERLTREFGKEIEGEVSVGFVRYLEERDRRDCPSITSWAISNNSSTISDNLKQIQICVNSKSGSTKSILTAIDEASNLLLQPEFQNETNIILMVGSMGSKNSNKNEKLISNLNQKISRANISLFAIQGRNEGVDGFDDFIFQIRDLIAASAETSIQKLNRDLAGFKVFDTKVSLKKREETSFWLEMDDVPFSGGLVYTRRNQPLDAELIERSIREFVYTLNRDKNRFLSEMTAAIWNLNPNNNTTISAGMLNFLLGSGIEMEDLSVLAEKKVQFLWKGYTPYQLPNYVYPLYEKVLFLDQDQLDGLILTFQRLIGEDRSTSRRRTQLQAIWKDELSTNYGLTESEIDTKTIAELLEVVTGIEGNSPILSKYRIRDFEYMADTEFRAFKNLIRLRFSQLQSITAQQDAFFRSNDHKFYWIPRSFFP